MGSVYTIDLMHIEIYVFRKCDLCVYMVNDNWVHPRD